MPVCLDAVEGGLAVKALLAQALCAFYIAHQRRQFAQQCAHETIETRARDDFCKTVLDEKFGGVAQRATDGGTDVIEDEIHVRRPYDVADVFCQQTIALFTGLQSLGHQRLLVDVLDDADEAIDPPVREPVQHLELQGKPAPAAILVPPAYPPLEHLAIGEHLFGIAMDVLIFHIVRMQQLVQITPAQRRLFLAAIAQRLGQRPVAVNEAIGLHVLDEYDVRYRLDHAGPETLALGHFHFGAAPLGDIRNAHGHCPVVLDPLRQSQNDPDVQQPTVDGLERRFHLEPRPMIYQRHEQRVAHAPLAYRAGLVA